MQSGKKSKESTPTSQNTSKGKRQRRTRHAKKQSIGKTPESLRHSNELSQPKRVFKSPLRLDHDLEPDPSTITSDKLAQIEALHARWAVEDSEQILEGNQLVELQKQRCKKVGKIIFRFNLRDTQLEAIWTLFYEQRDLLLLAKTSFGKSLIFQLLPFMLDPTGVVLILMPLKLLQAEQNAMINLIPNGKAIALTGENNQKDVQHAIATEGYTHVFTSPEIALSKKFKTNVLDHPCFAQRLSLLAIDEIHLIEEWGKSFRPLYAEIEKVRKRIPGHVPLLGVSATLTKKVRLRIIDKAGFRNNYKLMQTSLDQTEICQIHQFMQHSVLSCLDLQFILPFTVTAASDIQKTIIFINTVADIRPMINIIIG